MTHLPNELHLAIGEEPATGRSATRPTRAAPVTAMHRDAVLSVQMTAFRNHRRAILTPPTDMPIVLFGHNGAGKTNILEAISLLAPGRGLRGARLAECIEQGPTAPTSSGQRGWTINARIATAERPVDVDVRFRQQTGTMSGTGSDMRDRRTISLDGKTASPAQLSAHFTINWLTPAMDRLFLDSAGSRRRFFDRLIFGLDPGHAKRVNQYERSLRERRQLLAQSKYDPVWLDLLEQRIAAEAVSVAAARSDCARLLAADMLAIEAPFPRARLTLTGDVEQWLKGMPALDAEERFQAMLKSNRSRDAALERTGFGPHLSDIAVQFADTGRAAKNCSTGEQKIMLVGLILAHARALTRHRGQRPILLLDDVVAHLDAHRRGHLAEALLALGCQCWFTGTDRAAFDALSNRAIFYSVDQGQVTASPFPEEN